MFLPGAQLKVIAICSLVKLESVIFVIYIYAYIVSRGIELLHEQELLIKYVKEK